jgi:predicted lipoprotein with Yx(FWY)xxD motif
MTPTRQLATLSLALGFAGCAAVAANAPAKFSDGVLVGPNGKTLYTFDKDGANSGKSACNGPCATLWPPLAASASDQPAAGFTLVTRDDGSRQWAYQGKPLYYYQADQKPGERSGDNFREVWHIIKP